MHIFNKPCFKPAPLFRKHLSVAFLGLALLFNLGLAESADNPNSLSGTLPGTLVVTIKPLYSLLAQLTDGIVEPVLLLEQIPSAHHYNLRPSQRKLLANAGMIVWVGPAMESYLSKIIQQTDDTVAVAALSAKNLQLLQKRSQHSHDGRSFDNAVSAHEFHDIDPHIWLSSHNAIAISEHLAAALIRHDPVNRNKYEQNLSKSINKIKLTSLFMKNNLSVKNREYIAYHDAYQYIENELGLKFVDSMSFDENAGTSLKHAREINTLITSKNIRCLVYQAPKPAIVRTLQAQTSINAVALDPLALDISSDKNAWFELMQQMAVNFNQCLTTDSGND